MLAKNLFMHGCTTTTTFGSYEDEISFSSTEITFSPSNWNIPQTITVTGQDDSIQDGDEDFKIKSHSADSDDSDYDGQYIEYLYIINRDND